MGCGASAKPKHEPTAEEEESSAERQTAACDHATSPQDLQAKGEAIFIRADADGDYGLSHGEMAQILNEGGNADVAKSVLDALSREESATVTLDEWKGWLAELADVESPEYVSRVLTDYEKKLISKKAVAVFTKTDTDRSATITHSELSGLIKRRGNADLVTSVLEELDLDASADICMDEWNRWIDVLIKARGTEYVFELLQEYEKRYVLKKAGSIFAFCDANNDNELVKGELSLILKTRSNSNLPESVMEELDADESGVITLAEFEAWVARAFEIQGSDRAWTMLEDCERRLQANREVG
mmetsp:Transcript_24307/g.67583  ORF Transcript_24307/g.67583 Transcript_24307/m.67583 type:complete len:300 (-) Transcript_24307:281-1180(-)